MQNLKWPLFVVMVLARIALRRIFLTELRVAAKSGADGIGLFRTEFLYMSMAEGSPHVSARSFNEDEQFEAYKKVLELMKGKSVTIRTLDAGGDNFITDFDIFQRNPLFAAIHLKL